MPEKEFLVRAAWDETAQVWYVTESDVPGLVAEGATVEELQAKLNVLIPELVDLNGHLIDWEPNGDFPIHLMAERFNKVRLAS